MLVPSLFALVAGVLFALLWLTRRVPGAALAAASWLLYALYEYLMHLRLLCSGECNIRVDLLLLWPLLLIVGVAVPVRYAIRAFKARRRKPG